MLLPKETTTSFQSTPPCGGRPAAVYVPDLFLRFNPRPRAGGDAAVAAAAYLIIVSIHAPVRGATLGRLSERPQGSVSIHAPVRGATFFTRDIAQ